MVEKYELLKDCFCGKEGEIVEVDESGESSFWKNLSTGNRGSPFIEYNISRRVE